MPQETVTDPITDQEIAFACLILSGAMNDRRAAEAVGLNPTIAAYTKDKPRVRAYMLQHRAAVNEKLIDQEAEGQRTLNLGRDQILARLWQLANLDPEATRGSIAGQIKAMSMIIGIEGLIPDRRQRPVPAQPPSPPVQANIYVSEPTRRRQAETNQPGESVTAAEAQTAVSQAPEPPPPVQSPGPSPKPGDDLRPNHNQNTLDNPFLDPKGPNWVPAAMGRAYDVDLNPSGPFRLSIPSRRNGFPRNAKP